MGVPILRWTRLPTIRNPLTIPIYGTSCIFLLPLPWWPPLFEKEGSRSSQDSTPLGVETESWTRSWNLSNGRSCFRYPDLGERVSHCRISPPRVWTNLNRYWIPQTFFCWLWTKGWGPQEQINHTSRRTSPTFRGVHSEYMSCQRLESSSPRVWRDPRI